MLKFIGEYIDMRDKVLFNASSDSEMIYQGKIHIPELKKYSVISATINSFMVPIIMVKLKDGYSTSENFSGGSGFGEYTGKIYLMHEGNGEYSIYFYQIRNVETGETIDIENSVYKITNIRGIEPDKDKIKIGMKI